jgi:hypothetical protein
MHSCGRNNLRDLWGESMKYVVNENGVIRDMTPEEIAEMEEARRYGEAMERHRPLTESEVSRMLITEQINTLAVDDQTALRMTEFYPTFEGLVERSYTAKDTGFKFTHSGNLYKTVQANYTFVPHYVPDNGTESLFTRIDEEHDGSKYDPIPYDGNMALVSGLYYTQDGVLYRCTRDTGTPVYHALRELVGLYVDIV